LFTLFTSTSAFANECSEGLKKNIHENSHFTTIIKKPRVVIDKPNELVYKAVEGALGENDDLIFAFSIFKESQSPLK